MTKDQILNEAMSLEPAERDEVAETLWQSIVPGELTQQQMVEIHRRVELLNSGQMQTVPGEQVMQELRERLQR